MTESDRRIVYKAISHWASARVQEHIAALNEIDASGAPEDAVAQILNRIHAATTDITEIHNAWGRILDEAPVTATVTSSGIYVNPRGVNKRGT